MMKRLGKIVLYGFLLWLSVFAGSVVIFPVKASDPIFFETLISLILASATVVFGYLYFKTEKASWRSCLRVGIIWILVNIAIDLPLFSYGPMKRPIAEYMTDIGLTYLMIPIILLAFSLGRNNTIGNNPAE